MILLAVPDTLVTQVAQAMMPVAGRLIGPVALTATVPPVSGKLIALAAVGVVKPTVVVLPALVPLRVLAAVPWRVKAWPVAPRVKAPAGVIVRVPTLVIVSLVPPKVRAVPVKVLEL